MSAPEEPVPDLLNKTFHVVDARLSHLAQSGKTQSGCTAVTAFLRVEHARPAEEGEPRGFVNPNVQPRGLAEGKGEEEIDADVHPEASGGGPSGSGSANGSSLDLRRRSSGTGRRIRDFVGRLTGSSSDKKEESSASAVQDDTDENNAAHGGVEAIEPTSEHGLRRVLYTANVGDARAVLWYVAAALSSLWLTCSAEAERPCD